MECRLRQGAQRRYRGGSHCTEGAGGEADPRDSVHEESLEHRRQKEPHVALGSRYKVVSQGAQTTDVDAAALTD